MTASFPADPLLAEARACADDGAWAQVLTLLAPRASVDARDGQSAVLYGEALMRTGEERRALAWLRSIESYLAEDADHSAYRRAVNMIGAACLALGELDAATSAFSTALDLATQADDLLVLARATNNLGNIANLQGDHERALGHYRVALPTFQRLGQRRGLASSYHNMAITFRDLEQLEEADEHERRAIEYATEAAVPRLACMGRIGRAEIALRRGDAPLAEMTARLAAQELMRLGDPQNEADARRLVGAACTAQQKYFDALESFDTALAIAKARGHALNEAETLRDRVQVRVSQGEKALAIADARAAIAIFTKLGAVAECEALKQRLAHLQSGPALDDR
jgi:tetratricopeptide (TPR) repeat protein